MDDHDKGLAHDLDALGRRRVLFGAAGLAATTLLTAWGCGGADGADSTSSASGASGTSSGSGSCAVSAEETPDPADGSNTIAGSVSNALALTGIVRSDIRSSFASLSGTAAGVPTTLKRTLVDTGNGCADLSGYAICVWHCDRDGRYSIYGVTDQNYLRGVQVTDAGGVAEGYAVALSVGIAA